MAVQKNAECCSCCRCDRSACWKAGAVIMRTGGDPEPCCVPFLGPFLNGGEHRIRNSKQVRRIREGDLDSLTRDCEVSRRRQGASRRAAQCYGAT